MAVQRVAMSVCATGAAVGLALAGGASSAMAQQGATWDFASLSGAAASVPPGGGTGGVPSSANSALPGSVSAITRGAGLTAAAGTGALFSSGAGTTALLNLANNDYVEFTYTAPASGGVRLGQLRHVVQRGGTSTLNLRWHASTTGTFSTSNFPTGSALTGPNQVSVNGPVTGTASFPGLPGLRLNNGETVTFRLYAWNAGTGGNFRVDDVALLSTAWYTNSLERTWDRSMGVGTVDASAYSLFDAAGYAALLGAGSTVTGTFGISAQSGPTTLVAGVDYTFDAATRVLRLNDTPNVANGTYSFTYDLTASGVQVGTGPFGPTVLDSGTITVNVIPGPMSGAAGAVCGLMLMRGRRR